MTDTDATQAIETFVRAFYGAFDNRGSRVPDARALIAMFEADARIVRVSGQAVETWSPPEFVMPRVRMLSDGTLSTFREWEIEARSIVAGSVSHRWSCYRKAGVRDGTEFTGEGHKFIALTKHDTGWRIASIHWEDLR